MVIDTHIHPALFAPICEDQERFRRRCDAMNYHLMKPSDMALLRKQYALETYGVHLIVLHIFLYLFPGPPPPRCCAGAGTCLC